MRVIVTKPVAGKTTVTLDDTRGHTRLKRRAENVDVEDAGAVAGSFCDEWQQRRRAIQAARRGVQPA